MPTLLVIDDEESLRYCFRRIFEGDDVQVLTAATGTEGLNQVRKHRPDVIVLDLHLPDVPGLSVLREIHATDPGRPVILITAHLTPITTLECESGEPFEYLTKPVDLERLSKALARAFDVAHTCTR